MFKRATLLALSTFAFAAPPAHATTVDALLERATRRDGSAHALVVVADPRRRTSGATARRALAQRKREALRGIRVVEDFRALPVVEVVATRRVLRTLRGRRHVLSITAPRRGRTAQEAPGNGEPPPSQEPPSGQNPDPSQPGANPPPPGPPEPGQPQEPGLPGEQDAFVPGSLLGKFDGRGAEVVVADTGADLSSGVFGRCPRPGAPSCRVVLAAELAGDDRKQDDDPERHGTHVAAVLAASAPGVSLVVADVFRQSRDGLEWTTGALLRAVDLAVRRRQAGHEVAAVNLSIVEEGAVVGPCSAGALGAAVRTARASGIAVVAAAGNGAESTGRFRRGLATPACHEDAIAVGALHDSVESAGCDARVACFSQSARGLDLLARGVAVQAAGRTLSGTSQAAPQVAAAIAALSMAVPLADPEDVRAALTGAGEEIVDGRSGAAARALDAPMALKRLRERAGNLDAEPAPTPAQPASEPAAPPARSVEAPATVGAPVARLGGVPRAGLVPLEVVMPASAQDTELLVSVDGEPWQPADPAALLVSPGRAVRLAARAVTADGRRGAAAEGAVLRVEVLEAGDPRVQQSGGAAYVDVCAREVGAASAGAMHVDGTAALAATRGGLAVVGLPAGTHRVAAEGAASFVVLI